MSPSVTTSSMPLPFGSTALLMTSDESFDDVWSRVVPTEIENSARVAQWIGGRIAVQRAFAKAGMTIPPEAFANASFRRVVGHDDWSFSLSHTGEWAYAWVTKEKVSIGVDIEDAEREISSGVKTKFVFSDDMPIEPIRLWSLKEAAFKAVPDEHQMDLVVAKIRIHSDGSFSITDRDIRGWWHQETSGGLVRSFAWISRETSSR